MSPSIPLISFSLSLCLSLSLSLPLSLSPLFLSPATPHQSGDSKTWDDIIPESYRTQMEEEEKEREQLQLYLPPRQRTVRVRGKREGVRD